MRAAVLFALASCYPGGYQTVTSPFIGARASVGCLDVAVALTEDDVAPPPIVAYQFGNHCFHQTIVDLSAVQVTVRTGDGGEIALAARDPRNEIVPMQLDAWSAGVERIAYAMPAGVAARELCIDLGDLDANAPAPPLLRCVALAGGAP
jgi:hypothetical protein